MLCENCTDAHGMCLRTGPSCCAPCNTGGVVIPTKCGIGYYGTYPNCTKCPAGPNGEPTTSLGTSLTVSGCYIEIGTDFEDGTGYGEYVSSFLSYKMRLYNVSAFTNKKTPRNIRGVLSKTVLLNTVCVYPATVS